MSLSDAVVWIDHNEAHVIQFNAEASESEIIKTNQTINMYTISLVLRVAVIQKQIKTITPSD